MNSSNNKDLLKNDTVEDKSINEVSNVKSIDLNEPNVEMEYLVIGFDKPYGDNKLVNYQVLELNRIVDGKEANRLLLKQFPIDKQPKLFEKICVEIDKNGFNVPGRSMGVYSETALKMYDFLSNFKNFETIRNERLKNLDDIKLSLANDKTITQENKDLAISNAENECDINFIKPIECVVEGYIEKYTKIKTIIKTPSGLSIGIWHHDLTNPFYEIGIGSGDFVRAFGKIKNGKNGYEMNAYIYGIKKYIPEKKPEPVKPDVESSPEVKSKPEVKSEPPAVVKGLDECEPTPVPEPIKSNKSSSIISDNLTVEMMSDVAKTLKAKYHCKVLEAASLDNEYMLVWADGYYQKNREGLLRNEVKEIVGDAYSQYWFSTVLNHIKAMDKPYKWSEFKQKPFTVNLRNGILDYSDETKEPVFIERKSPDDFNDYNFDYIIPVDYNPKAECFSLNKVLIDILVDRVDTNDDDYKSPLEILTNDKIDDDSTPEYKKLFNIYDYLGSCLMYNIEVKKVPVLLGIPNSGKSTLLNIIRQLLGDSDNNICCVNVQDMSGQFTGANIDGALANIVDELVSINAKNIDKFKGMVAGSVVEVERKRKDRYKIIPKAKMIMAGNKTFGMDRDVMDDFMSRIVAIECNNKFTETADKTKCRNSRIKDKKYSDEELSGLLNYAIRGLIRLMKRGDYNHDEAEDYELWVKYMKTVNYAEEFIELKVEATENPMDIIEKWELYDEYRKWYKVCGLSDTDILSEKEFSHDVSVYFGNNIDTRYIDDKNETIMNGRRIQKPCWKYLTYKTQINQSPSNQNIVVVKHRDDIVSIPSTLTEEDKRIAIEEVKKRGGWMQKDKDKDFYE